jgi:hypothetical protein
MTEPIYDPEQIIDPEHLVETPESLRDSDPDMPPYIDLGIEESDHYLAAEKWGVTVEEERRGEPLDLRLSEEEPEAVSAAGPPDPLAGRLVQEDEGSHPDREKDEVAEALGVDGGDLGAEELAVHIIDEP